MRTKRVVRFSVLGVLLLLVCGVLSVALGSKRLPVSLVMRVLCGEMADSFEAAVVFSRLPRTVFGIMAGSALGVSGVLMQSITRNPIADPSILGVNTGASLFVVMGIAWFRMQNSTAVIWLAFAGAAIAAVTVYGIAAAGGGGADPMKLALAGAAVSTALSSLVSTIMLPDSQVMKAFRFWQVGSVSGTTWQDIQIMLPYLLVGFLLALCMVPNLNALALGDEMATSLGINVNSTRLLSALAGVLLCAATTALAGPIGFVGLMVPHLIRMAVGGNLKVLLPLSAVYGSILLVLSDVLGRLLGSPGELEVGIITAILGAPVYILIVRKAKVQSL